MLNLDLMSQFYPKNLYSLFSNTMFSSAGGFPKGLPFDMHSILEMQRKNVQAMSEAQEILLAGMQSVSRQQSEIVSSMIENQSNMISLLMTEGTPEEKITRAAELKRTQYKATLKDIRSLQDTMTDTIRSAADILHGRTTTSLGENQRAVKNALVAANSDEISRQRESA